MAVEHHGTWPLNGVLLNLPAKSQAQKAVTSFTSRPFALFTSASSFCHQFLKAFWNLNLVSPPYFAKITVNFETTHVVQGKYVIILQNQNFPEIYGGKKKKVFQILGLQQTHGGQFHEQTTFQGICQEIETVRLDHGLSGWEVFFVRKNDRISMVV